MVGKEIFARLQNVDKTLKLLFGDISISREALEIATNEIRLFSKNKQPLHRKWLQ